MWNIFYSIGAKRSERIVTGIKKLWSTLRVMYSYLDRGRGFFGRGKGAGGFNLRRLWISLAFLIFEQVPQNFANVLEIKLKYLKPF